VDVVSAGPVRFLGIDLGTTNIKAQIVAEDGSVKSSGAAAVRIAYGAGGSAEQDMEDIWTGTLAAIGQAVRSADAPDVAAVGISSQGGALQVLDRDGRPAGPVIGWQDSRGGPWDAGLTARKGSDWFSRQSGVARSFGAAGQILRLREQGALPRDFRLGWVGDVIVGRLCGRPAHDGTSLSEAGLYNPSLDSENREVLALAGIDREQLPALLPVNRAAGGLLPDVAASVGLRAGIAVGPAVHDQYAAATGCGVVRDGDTMLGAGTAWVLLALAATLDPPVGGVALVGRHPVPGIFGQMLSMVNGGACITWAAKLLNRAGMGVRETDALLAEAPPGSDGLRFRPLLSALGAAGLPRGLGGCIDGLTLGTTPACVMRSLVEGLACELARYLGILAGGGVAVRRLVMCGKAATSTVTPGILADTTGLPVDCMTVPETSSVGAAVLARLLVEPGASLVALSDAMRPEARRVEPGPDAPAARGRLERYLDECAAATA
jgi:xylulokinase